MEDAKNTAHEVLLPPYSLVKKAKLTEANPRTKSKLEDKLNPASRRPHRFSPSANVTTKCAFNLAFAPFAAITKPLEQLLHLHVRDYA